MVLLLIAAGGPTVAVGLALAEQITQHPWKALFLALFYGFLVLVFGFVGKVWQNLESRWVERAVIWIDIHLQGLFSRYRKCYLEHLIYRYRDFDVKGLTIQGTFTLELERVFVELAVVPQPPHRVSSDPLRALSQELREGRHVIWNYLRSELLSGQSLAVIGPPGSGKTTLLKHMTLRLTTERRHRKRLKVLDKLPILLFLRDHAEAITENPDLSLEEAVRAGLARQSGPAAPPGWFARQLARGQCLVMLDGLDEVADPDTRRQVVTWVERQMTACRKNRFVVTSRPHGYRSNPLSKVTVLEVMPFDRGQVQRFVRSWYLANEIMATQKDDPGVQMKAREGAEDLLRRIWSTPALSDLAVNPLLLTMIANVHRWHSSLPGRRVELYAEICEVFLGKRQAARGVEETELAPAQKRRVLQPLAYHMMVEQQREIALDEAVRTIEATLSRVSPRIVGESFLKMIENTSGLLVEQENGVYSFAHLTFQEYLASVHAREARLENALLKQVEDSWWHETIRLYCAQADATPVIQACLKEEPLSIPSLTLAIACGDEACELHPEVRARLEAILDEGVEDEDPERRRIIAQALLNLRLHRMVRVSEDKYIDPIPITHAEYQIFLDQQRVRGKYHQPDHWLAYQFPEGQGRKPVVGVRLSDAVAFCEWLTQREVGPWLYRLPRKGELAENIGGGAPENGAETGVGYWCVSGDESWLVISKDQNAGPTMAWLSEWIYADSNRARAHVLDLARDFKLDVSVGLPRTHPRLSSTDIDIRTVSVIYLGTERRFALDIAPATELHLDLDRDRALARALDRARAHDRDFDRALDIACHLGRDLDITLAVALARALGRACDLDVVALALALALARARTRVLDIARDLDITRDLDLRTLVESRKTLGFRRWYIRALTLWAAVVLLQSSELESWRQRLSFDDHLSRQPPSGEFQVLIDNCLDLYVDFAILEARIRGDLPAFEGICIVKERIRGDDIECRR